MPLEIQARCPPPSPKFYHYSLDSRLMGSVPPVYVPNFSRPLKRREQKVLHPLKGLNTKPTYANAENGLVIEEVPGWSNHRERLLAKVDDIMWRLKREDWDRKRRDTVDTEIFRCSAAISSVGSFDIENFSRDRSVERADVNVLHHEPRHSLLSSDSGEWEDDDGDEAMDVESRPPSQQLEGEPQNWMGDVCDQTTEKERLKQKREVRKRKHHMADYARSLRKPRKASLTRTG
jgi:hypothetical protein